MKSILTLALVVTVTLSFSAEAYAQDTGGDDEKVYTAKEVDVKAKLKNNLEHLPQRKKDCPETVHAKVRAVLHKSGKVTEVNVTESSGCSYDAEVIKTVRQLKFTPALKDGHSVSQYLELEYDSRPSGSWRHRPLTK